MSRVLGLAVASAVLLSVGAVAAQEEPSAVTEGEDTAARLLFLEGRSLFDEGRYEEALHSFRRAYQLSRRPTLWYNIALACDRLRMDAEALEGFRAYLREVPDAPHRVEVEARIEALRAAVYVAPDEAAARVEPIAADPAARADEGGVARRWWFWTLLAVVVGGAVTATLLATSGDEVADPLDVGVRIETLGTP